MVPRLAPPARVFDNVLTVREVAARLKVTTATVYALLERGDLPHFRIGAVMRVRRADLEAFMAKDGR